MELFQKYKLLLPLLVCAAITLCMGLYLLTPHGDRPAETENETERETETNAPEEDFPPMPSLNFKTDLSAYEQYMTASGEEYLILVNKENPLASDYVPSNLTAVKDARKDIYLERAAEMALEAMFIEMRAAGFTDVFVTSAYRSYAYQNSLFNTYINDEMRKDPSLTQAQAQEKVLRYSAYPGTSEHQTGLCVDLMVNSMTELDESFADYDVYDWLYTNAWKFGFILRYPIHKTGTTGYDFEPWHYRFVGRNAAHTIRNLGWCLEDYLGSRGAEQMAH